MLGRDECDAPLTVDHHGQLPTLECVRGGELVTRARLPLPSLPCPYQSIKPFCHFSSFCQLASLPGDDLPEPSKYFAPTSG